MSLPALARVRVNERYAYHFFYPFVGIVAEHEGGYNHVLFTQGESREGLFTDEELELA